MSATLPERNGWSGAIGLAPELRADSTAGVRRISTGDLFLARSAGRAAALIRRWSACRSSRAGAAHLHSCGVRIVRLRAARPHHDRAPYTRTGEGIARLAANGVRLVVEELRCDVTKTRKDDSRGRLRIDYGDHRDPQAAISWLWKFIVCRAAGYAESALGSPWMPAQPRVGG